MSVSPALQASPSRELKLQFTGTASEYFRIWIVNLCLTLMTLGIFSAWAKVRKKRYFYSHTVLDGTPFQYLGQPLPILKGRVVAVVMFAVYYAASHFFTSLLPVVIAAALVAAPWAIARSAAFTARYSAYRNMTFSFTGDYRGTLRTIYWLGLIPIVAVGMTLQANMAVESGKAVAVIGIAFALLGVLFPWWLARLRTFLVSKTAFGGVNADIDIRGGQFWGIYFRGGLLGAVGGAATGGVSAVLVGALKLSPYLTGAVVLVSLYAGYVLGYAYIKAASANLVWNNTTLEPLRFVSTLRARAGMAVLEQRHCHCRVACPVDSMGRRTHAQVPRRPYAGPSRWRSHGVFGKRREFGAGGRRRSQRSVRSRPIPMN